MKLKTLECTLFSLLILISCCSPSTESKTRPANNLLLNDSYQKWIWIELIGFDNTLPDYGVQNYLDRCKFIPDGASLLLTWTEFVLGYQGMEHGNNQIRRELSNYCQ